MRFLKGKLLPTPSDRSGAAVPKMGIFVHLIDKSMDYRTAMATALHEELGNTYRAIEVAMLWTGASERTVKYWFAGELGPRGDHLIALARHSDVVLFVASGTGRAPSDGRRWRVNVTSHQGRIGAPTVMSKDKLEAMTSTELSASPELCF